MFAFLKTLPPKMDVFRTKQTILECFVNHEDCIPKWYRNGQLIAEDDKRYKITQERVSGRCSLRIAKNVNADAGEYTCCINDLNDRVETNKTVCYLYVEEPAFKFTKRLPTQTEAGEDMPFELDCEIEDEDAECEWFFNGDVNCLDSIANQIELS